MRRTDSRRSGDPAIRRSGDPAIRHYGNGIIRDCQVLVRTCSGRHAVQSQHFRNPCLRRAQRRSCLVPITVIPVSSQFWPGPPHATRTSTGHRPTAWLGCHWGSGPSGAQKPRVPRFRVLPISPGATPVARTQCYALRAERARHQSPPPPRHKIPDRETSQRSGSKDREGPIREHCTNPLTGARQYDGGRLPPRQRRPAHLPLPPRTDSTRSPHRHRAEPAREGRPVCRSLPAGFTNSTAQPLEVIRIGRNGPG